jgi:DNA-binding NarL/FixJ family response regulator
MTTVRVLLVDDHEVVRAGLGKALTSLANVEIVGEAGSGRQLDELLRQLQPDLLVIDVAMPDFEPVPAIRRVKADHPELKILVVSAYDDEAYVVGLLGAGVDGYHLKDQPLADLKLAVERILAGERWISSPLVNRLVHRTRPVAAPAAPALPALTRRQRELLHLLRQGHDNRKIAQSMELSVKTVENHLTALYRAIGVNSRLEALNFAVRNPEVLAAVQPEPAEAEAGAFASLTVLVVDDNPHYRQQLGRQIGKSSGSVSIYEAEDMAEAVRLAARLRPQLAWVDVVLKDEDGIQCARRIKAISPGTRVVLISAYPDQEFRRLGLGAGAVAFLDKKDLDAAVVRQVVEDAMK